MPRRARRPDGKQLAGCAIDKQWLSRLGELAGKVRVWELSAEPKAQLPPKHLDIKKLPNPAKEPGPTPPAAVQPR